MASCFQHINECLYVVKSQLRSHWAIEPVCLSHRRNRHARLLARGDHLRLEFRTMSPTDPLARQHYCRLCVHVSTKNIVDTILANEPSASNVAG